MFDIYKQYCTSKSIGIGKLWLYKGQQDAPWVLNFPTKYHWKYPSKINWIEKGLQKFVETYEKKGISSIAFPLLGTQNGGLDTNEVRKLMDDYLGKCEIDIEIYDYDPDAKDDLFALFKEKWLSLDEKKIKKETGIQPQYARKITEIILSGEINSMISLANYEGIGEKTLEKAFGYILN